MSITPVGSPSRWRTLRLAAVLLAVVAFASTDIAMLDRRQAAPQWGVRVNALGVVTWLDPDNSGYNAGLKVGDRILRSVAEKHDTYAQILSQRTILVSRIGRISLDAVIGSTQGGQSLVLIGLLLLTMGGLAWAYGRARAPALLAIVSASVALTLLSYVWSNTGEGWTLRLDFVAGSVVAPVAWAAFFLSFPRDRFAIARWRLAFAGLLALAFATLATYALCLTIDIPYALPRALTLTVFPGGLVLGLVSLLHGGRGLTQKERQQRRLLLLSAAGTMLPVLLLSFLPTMILGHGLLPYETSGFALMILPLGISYAIVRYDLMELDVVVRRTVAVVLATFVLIALAVISAGVLQPFAPSLDVATMTIATLAGAIGGRYVSGWARKVVDKLLSPELTRSRRLLDSLDPAGLRGVGDLAVLSTQLEGAARDVTGVQWAQVLVRRRVPGAVFCALDAEAVPVEMPGINAALQKRRWGVGAGDGNDHTAANEWERLKRALPFAPALLVPLRMRDEVVAMLAVGERSAEEPLRGPDREALALLTAHFALALDHARVRAELVEEGKDAAAFSEANAALSASLDDRDGLPRRIVAALAAMRDVRAVALVLYGPDGAPMVAAHQGDIDDVGIPNDPSKSEFAPEPLPHAWLPLSVGGEDIGALRVRWRPGHMIRDHERRLLLVYAAAAAMALEQARLYERARIQAERDPVTDLYNHRAFHTRLEAAIEHARTAGGQVGLLLIDLADFKLFNDTHGHQAGDHALRRVGEVLVGCCRTSDAAARLGGDEFALLLPDSDIESARAVAERVTDLAAISALTSPDGHYLPVRLSIGVAAYPDDAGAANALLARADERMYEAKRAGVAVSTVGRAGFQNGDEEGYARFGILESLVAMVDNRDRYTGEHSEQVATYACALGAELGLSHETLETLRLAGLLHDVGKIGVPDRILRKPSKLTDEEFEIVKRHVELSEALLMVVSQDRDLMDAVRYHHERWDGGGYPRGVGREQIPLLGRIMIVADAVSAMGMDRPYRKGLSWEIIARELLKGAGGQFDPDLVRPALHALQPLIGRAVAA